MADIVEPLEQVTNNVFFEESDQLIIDFRALTDLDESTHWFCPRTGDDLGYYYDEDVPREVLGTESAEEKARRHKKVAKIQEMREQIFSAMRIFAFDGGDAGPYQDKLKACLASQLTRCDICIREYHRLRTQFELHLEGQYEQEEVTSFLNIYDGINKERIAAGLKVMHDNLLALPEKQRTISNAGNVGMFAMFEALNCVPFLKDEQTLKRDFDKPFEVVNSKKKLRLPSYVPAVGAFLFAPIDSLRWEWAKSNLEKNKTELTSTHWEHCFKSWVEDATARVDVKALEPDFVPRYWRGIKLLLSHFTKPMIAHDLRSMDRNIYMTGLEHFQLDDAHLTYLLEAYQKLLELGPSDFWEALGTVPAQRVVENILESPVMKRMMRVTLENEPIQLLEKLQWMGPFLRSINPMNLSEPTNALLNQLLHRLQDGNQYSHYARETTWQVGMECLQQSLILTRDHVKGGIVIQQMIEAVVVPWFQKIMEELEHVEQKSILEPLDLYYLGIVEHCLALDVQSLSYDRAEITKNTNPDHDLGISGLKIWKWCLRSVEKGNPHLPKAILSGITGLLPLEKFSIRQVKVAPKLTEKFNAALDRVLSYVIDSLLGGLSNLLPHQSQLLLVEQRPTTGLVSLLLSGNPDVHSAALNVVMEMTEQDSRRESLRWLVENHPTTVIEAICQCQQAVHGAKNFDPSSMILKITSEIFDALCNDHDGLLRSPDLLMQMASLNNFWTWTWNVVSVMFAETENWATMGYEKDRMAEFCREVLDFADNLFDQYSIIVSALQGDIDNQGTRNDIATRLMKPPREAFGYLTRFLRLRDEWLIDKAVGLTSKMLVRLRETGVNVAPTSADYVEKVVTTSERSPGYIKTKLSMTHKAELQRALEAYLGQQIAPVVELEPTVPKRQGTLSFSGSSGARSASPASTTMTSRAKTGTIDLDKWTSGAQKQKEKGLPSSTLPSKRPESKLIKTLGSVATKSAQTAQLQGANKTNDFMAKRQKDKEEADKRKAAYLAKTKGTGAGTGAQNLGNLGKDHSKPGEQLMISSDEESEDDDDDDDLFGPRPDGRKGKKVNMPNVENIKAEQKKPMKIQRAQRSARDMRARLKPDLGPLHKTILQWDFFHTGDYPPLANEHQFQKVANVYHDPTTYQTTFQPLLTLEAWQGLVRSRDENMNKPYGIKISSRSNVDGMVEIGSVISFQENREIQLREGDIILLSTSSTPAQSPEAPNALARIYKLKQQRGNLEVVYQLIPRGALPPHLTTGQEVHGIKVTSIVPLEREYGALQALMYYDLCNQIVKARPSPKIDYSEQKIQQCQDVWNVNRAQSEAINAALENEGFSLIQGPPGSGKTKTIVAIVGGILSSVLGEKSANGATRITAPKATNGGANGASMDTAPKKLLVCAPSNAAVDELVMRLKEGVKTRTGKHHPINVVRIGKSEAINPKVLEVTMDELVQKKLGNTSDPKKRETDKEVYAKHKTTCNTIREKVARTKEAGGDELQTLNEELAVLRRNRGNLANQIENIQDDAKGANRSAELSKKRAQQSVLDEAHVICATLSGSGHDLFQNVNIEFETVIIDEAAQCVEMSSLIPLKYGCIKCIMVGDPKQLPPTVFSKEAARFQYEQSLFVRMQNNAPKEVHLLDTQYRMHPDISVFPSKTFYDSLLKDGPGMAGIRNKPWHSSAILAPYRFFDVAGQHQTGGSHSLVNFSEIQIAMALYDRLTTDYPKYTFTGQIGIITPYKAQLKMLREKFSARYGPEIFETIDFNTTDAFQGRESEIIIFSCVRANPSGGVGFLQDIRRMNVGLTRAKSSLWVLGNSQSLVKGKFWKMLVEDARARDCYSEGDLKQLLSLPSSKFPAAKGNLRAMTDASQMGVTGAGANGMGAAGGNGAAATAANGKQHGMNGSVTLQDQDKMEGVTYKFADRVAGGSAKKRQADGDANGARKTYRAEDQDVDMADADADADEEEDDDLFGGPPAKTGTKKDSETSLRGGASKSERMEHKKPVTNMAPATASTKTAPVPANATAPAHVPKKVYAPPKKSSAFMPRRPPPPRKL